MQDTIATEMLTKTVRLVAIMGFICASCFTGSASRGDDTVTKSQDRPISLEDLIGNIIEDGTATLLSSLHVGKGVEKSLWETIVSPESWTCEELTQMDRSDGCPAVFLVELIVPNESDLIEKRKLAPFAEDVPIQVSYNVLKRKVDHPLASMYHIDVRQARNPQVRLAAFFVFDIEKRTWSRRPM